MACRPSEQLGIGIVVPHDMALDRELWRWTPQDVTLLLTRTPFTPMEVTVEMARLVGDARLVAAAARDVAFTGPLVCAYVCTSGSFVRGTAGERELVAAMIGGGIANAVTTSGALVEALHQLEARTVSIATPYDDAITYLLAEYLCSTGFEVVGSANLGLTGGIPAVPAEKVAELIRGANHPASDAVVVSCTNMHTYDLIPALEAQLGKPVVSANQATMWAALRRIDRRAVGPGQRLVDA